MTFVGLPSERVCQVHRRAGNSAPLHGGFSDMARADEKASRSSEVERLERETGARERCILVQNSASQVVLYATEQHESNLTNR